MPFFIVGACLIVVASSASAMLRKIAAMMRNAKSGKPGVIGASRSAIGGSR